MAYVNIINIRVKENPVLFSSPILLTVTFECLKDIPEELEWKIIYVGSSDNESYDQVIESFSMGPLNQGLMEFDLEAEAPDASKIPSNELLGVTALILTVSYKGSEFFRIGYYVYNNYADPELVENPPEQVALDKVYRNILADKPRITRFEIQWEPQAENVSMMIEESNTPNEYNKNISPAKDMEIVTDMGPSIADSNDEKNLDTKNPFFSELMGPNPFVSADDAFTQN